MKDYEMVAEAVIFGAAGMKANNAIQIPISSGNSAVDLVADLAIGLVVAYGGIKMSNKELGVGMVAAGLGWTLNSGAKAAGFSF